MNENEQWVWTKGAATYLRVRASMRLRAFIIYQASLAYSCDNAVTRRVARNKDFH